MAVLIEAISIVVKRRVIKERYPGGFAGYFNDCPNSTFCADPDLVRIGLMSPVDTEAFVNQLARHNIQYLEDGQATDLVVVDQYRGPMTACQWITTERVFLDEAQTQAITVAWMSHEHQDSVNLPSNWKYENSLSCSSIFVPAGQEKKSMTFLRHENGIDIFLNEMTGEEVYMGRTGEKVPAPKQKNIAKPMNQDT